MSFGKNKLLGLLGFGVIFILIFVAMRNWRFVEWYHQFRYDQRYKQSEIKDAKDIDKIYSDFEKMPYKKIDDAYLKFTKSDVDKYKKMLLDKEYLILHRDDFFRYVVGDIRIHQLLAKDKYYKACLKDKSQKYYWLIKPQLLKKLLHLRSILEEKGYDKNAFTITNGHRHPLDNERVGGAKLSRHIKGEAIDIHINDINKNGHYDDEDKEIVLDLLETQIIKSEGGIGRYPGTRSVHFDVRGYKARWDSY